MEPKSNKNFFKIIGLSALVLTFWGVGYWVLFSPRLANVQTFITIRNRYATMAFNFKDWLGLASKTVGCGNLGLPVRTLKTMNEHGYKYIYLVKGVLVAIDPDNQTMIMKCGNDREYKVRVEILTYPIREQGWYEVKGSQWGEKGAVNKSMLFYPSDMARSREKDSFYKSNDIYTVVWPDARELTEILANVENNPEASVNMDGKAVLGVLR